MKNPMKSLLWIRNRAILAVCALALASLCSAGNAWAATITVTNLNDSGDGSLRQAIATAAAGDKITFRVRGTIMLTSGALTIGKNLNVVGPGAKRLKISANNASRVFVILPNLSVMLSGMTISDGLADGNSPFIPCVGGGILSLNFANLTLSEVVVSDNQALGDASKSPLSPGFPGAGFGGGVANLGILDINDSSFKDNLARGGDYSTWNGAPDRPLAAFGAGGGIINFGQLLVTGSSFRHNQAVGGSDSSSPFLSGHGYGGAIVSGAPGATLDVSYSEFDHNQAIGGDRNISPGPASIGPNKSSGGAIDVTGGTATIDNCTLDHNQSIGGAGASGTNGGIGAGGAIVSTNFGQLGTYVTISNSKVEHNLALGGPGSPGYDGGEAEGGGLTSTAGGSLTITDTTIAHNHAQGGEGGNGGNGLGGGLYDSLDSITLTELILKGAVVSHNLALGGEAEDGGSDGQGIGGGVYHLGPYPADAATVIEKNQASTSHKDVGP